MLCCVVLVVLFSYTVAKGSEIHFNGGFGYEVHEGEDKHRILGLGGEEMIQFFLIGFGSKDVNMGLGGQVKVWWVEI